MRSNRLKKTGRLVAALVVCAALFAAIVCGQSATPPTSTTAPAPVYLTFNLGARLDLSQYAEGTRVYLVPSAAVAALAFPTPTEWSRSTVPVEGRLVQKISDKYPWKDCIVRWVGGKAAGAAGEVAAFNESPGAVRVFPSDPPGTYLNENWPPALATVTGARGLAVEVVGRVRAPAEILVVEDSVRSSFVVKGEAALVRVHGNRPAVLDKRGDGNSYALDVASASGAFRCDDAKGAPANVTGRLSALGSPLGDMGAVYVGGRTKPGYVRLSAAEILKAPCALRSDSFTVGVYGDDMAGKFELASSTVRGFDVGAYSGGVDDCTVRDVRFEGVAFPIVSQSRAHWSNELRSWWPDGSNDGVPERSVFERNTTDSGLVSSEPRKAA